MKMPKLFAPFSAAMLCSLSVHAQDLIVTMLSGEANNYPVEDIRSITFPGNAMAVNLNSGTTISFDIADILDYQFDMSVSTENLADNAEGPLLKIYPNPSSERVQIAYTGRESAALVVEILDGNGRLVKNLYRGGHSAETNLVWHPVAVAKGTYLCRVTAGDRVLTGKIIVQ